MSVLANSAWILGLAIILAALSYVYWEASQTKQTFRSSLVSPTFQLPLYGGLTLIGLGLLGTGGSALEVVLAALMTAGSAFAFIRSYQARSAGKRPS